jgi:two-component system sensor histidine kinase CreC
MKLGMLLFAAFVGIVIVCFAYPIYLVADRLRIVYLESAEEPLVDAANILAEMVSQSAERDALDRLDVEPLRRLFQGVEARELDARIYEIVKRDVDLDVYMTDARGIVLFDSRGPQTLGRDYSKWRDVSRTLAGRYGARVRSSREARPLPHALYVAAPIRLRGEIAGVLTVIKPTTSVQTFLKSVKPRLLAIAALATSAAIVLAFLVSLWVTQQVGRLTRYADHVREGERVPFPRLAPTELRTMGLAFERMRASLAGQTYVEQYVRALTHEIKSPISAIRGAAEILETPTLDDAQRAHFLGTVRDETRRIEDLVDRMLELSELEHRRALPERTKVALAPILRTLLEAQHALLASKSLRVDLAIDGDPHVHGDGFLLHLALSNLLKNAIEFSPQGGCVGVRCEREGALLRVSVQDEGPGIPEYAQERIFERFYSLARPDTGRKSTGLGLNFVREIAALHHGEVRVHNRSEGGLRASIAIPIAV